MANTVIQLKKSGVSGNIPSSLTFGELGLNYADGKLYYKNASNTITYIAAATTSNSFSTINANSSLILASSNTDILSIVPGNNISITTNTQSKSITISSTGGSSGSGYGTTINSSRLSYTANAGDTVFTAPSYVTGANQLRVYINGVRMFPPDYSETSTTSFTLTSPCYAGDVILVEVDGYVSSNGVVTNIASNAGRITVSGTSNVTLDLATTGVVAGSFGSQNQIPVVSVDQYGRILSISNTSISIPPGTTIFANSGQLTANASTGNVAIGLATTGVSAGSYGNTIVIPSITVDSYGRLTSVSNNTLSGTANNLTANSAYNIVGGSANQIIYQSGTNSSGFITAPVSPNTYLKWTTQGFSWANTGISPWVVKTANYTAIAGDQIIANTYTGSFTVSLPASPIVGDSIAVTAGYKWSSNNVIVSRNGNSIGGIVDDLTLNVDNSRADFIWDGITWQYTTNSNIALNPWIIKSTNYTAIAGDQIIANTYAGSFTVTLPASPFIGDSISIADGYLFGANNLTVARNGNTIQGDTQDYLLDVNFSESSFIWDGSTWKFITNVGVVGATGATGVTGPAGATGLTGATGPGYLSTSSTVFAPSSYPAGSSLTVTVNTGLSYSLSQSVVIQYSTDPSIFVIGKITNYNSSTGSLTVTITYGNSYSSALGTWNVNLSGMVGATGLTGATGATGPSISTTANTLSFGSGLTGTSFNGSSNVTVTVDSTVGRTTANLSQFASTTSADLAGVISDETGSGSLVFGTAPTISNPTVTTGSFSNPTLISPVANTASVFGSISTPNTSFSLLTANATSISFGSAATTLSIGASTGNTTINNNLSVSGNLVVAGNTTTVNSTNLELTDSLIYLAQGNSANVSDIGIVGHFTSDHYQHTGFVRDATDGTWKLFSNVAVEPSTTIDFTGALYENLKLGSLESTGSIILDTATTNGVAYINSSKVLTTGSALTFDGSNLTAPGFSGPINGAIGATTANTGSFTTLSASGTVTFSSTGAIQLPVGSTAQQPVGSGGMLRFNSSTLQFEGYNGSAWASVGGAAISNDTTTASVRYPLFAANTSGTALTVYTSNTNYTYTPSTGALQAPVIIASDGLLVNSNTVSSSYSIPVGSNAISAGPISIAAGKSVTIPGGSRWVIL